MTASSILTVDIGNTRIKWGVWQDGYLVKQGAQTYADEHLPAVLSGAWYELEVPTRIMFSCVAGNVVEAELNAWIEENWQMQPRKLVTTNMFAGLRHAYPQPEQHGTDRWAAMIAAHEIYSERPLCVISCGTATTLDVIDEGGRHLGGQIMPGVDLMFTALRSRIPVLSNFMASSEVPATLFANNTVDAVQLGVTQMAAAGIDRACDAVWEMLGANTKILVTGGAGAAMLALMKNSAELQPDLVLRGLYLASQQENS